MFFTTLLIDQITVGQLCGESIVGYRRNAFSFDWSIVDVGRNQHKLHSDEMRVTEDSYARGASAFCITAVLGAVAHPADKS
jgi:hypothetical protein